MLSIPDDGIVVAAIMLLPFFAVAIGWNWMKLDEIVVGFLFAFITFVLYVFFFVFHNGGIGML